MLVLISQNLRRCYGWDGNFPFSPAEIGRTLLILPWRQCFWNSEASFWCLVGFFTMMFTPIETIAKILNPWHFTPWKMSSCRGDLNWKPDKEILDQVLFVSAACGWLRESKGLNQETPALKLCLPNWVSRLVNFTLLTGKSPSTLQEFTPTRFASFVDFCQ